MKFHSDYDGIYLLRDEIGSLLQQVGFPLDLGTDDASPTTGEAPLQQTPSWMKLYAAKSSLRLYEAAYILHAKEPPETEPRHINDATRDVFKSQSVLCDLVTTGDISTFNTSRHIDDEPRTWLLDHSSILDWCRRKNYQWPLASLMIPADESTSNGKFEAPHAKSTPDVDTDGLHQRVASLEQEVRNLQEKVEALSAQVPLHPGGLLGMAVQVQRDYWQSPEEKRPKSEVIVQELRSQHPGISDAQARAIEKVACPISRHK